MEEAVEFAAENTVHDSQENGMVQSSVSYASVYADVPERDERVNSAVPPRRVYYMDHDERDLRNDPVLAAFLAEAMDPQNQKFQAKPLSEKSIRSLKRRRPSDEEVAMQRCVICLESFTRSNKLMMMACHCVHSYHEKCLETWLRIKNACPLCRMEVIVNSEQEQSTKMNRLNDVGEEYDANGGAINIVIAPATSASRVTTNLRDGALHIRVTPAPATRIPPLEEQEMEVAD